MTEEAPARRQGRAAQARSRAGQPPKDSSGRSRAFWQRAGSGRVMDRSVGDGALLHQAPPGLRGPWQQSSPLAHNVKRPGRVRARTSRPWRREKAATMRHRKRNQRTGRGFLLCDRSGCAPQLAPGTHHPDLGCCCTLHTLEDPCDRLRTGAFASTTVASAAPCAPPLSSCTSSASAPTLAAKEGADPQRNATSSSTGGVRVNAAGCGVPCGCQMGVA